MKKIFILTLTFFILFASCKKESSVNEINLAYEMLGEKIWYLKYIQTVAGTKITEKNYLGQSTYFIKLLKDQSTVDSDGMVGKYNVENVNGILQIHVNAETRAANNIEYIYNRV